MFLKIVLVLADYVCVCVCVYQNYFPSSSWLSTVFFREWKVNFQTPTASSLFPFSFIYDYLKAVYPLQECSG